MRTPRSPLLGSRALRPRAGLPRHVLAPGRVPVAMNGRVMLCEVARANKGFPTLPSSRERRGPASSQDRRPSRSAEGRWIERTGERAAALRSWSSWPNPGPNVRAVIHVGMGSALPRTRPNVAICRPLSSIVVLRRGRRRCLPCRRSWVRIPSAAPSEGSRLGGGPSRHVQHEGACRWRPRRTSLLDP